MERKEKRRKVVVSALGLAGLLVLSLFAIAGNLEPSAPPAPTMKTLDEVEPRVPIHASDLPLTITEPNSYYLAEDINFTSTANHAITIECNDVTIDLMGYTLKGQGSGTKSGIYMNGRTNVEMRNGTIRDFYGGIYEASNNGTQHRVMNIRAVSNQYYGIRLLGKSHLIKDCTATKNGNDGLCAGSGSTVTGNTVYSNSDDGIQAGAYNTLTNNTTYLNGDDGIQAGDGCTVTGNTASGNGHRGIGVGSYSIVTGNTVSWSTNDGIEFYKGCRVIGNICDNSGWDGDGAGIHATNTENRIEGNHVTYNDRGIDVDNVNNLIVKNSASGNTTEYDIVPGNKVGTISTDPTTAGPWDNFDL